MSISYLRRLVIIKKALTKYKVSARIRRILFTFFVLKIRLQRKGRKKSPFYRIVIAEHTSPVNGKFIEILGTYDPVSPSKPLTLDADRLLHYVKNGAKPSDTVARLAVKSGVSECEKFVKKRLMKPAKVKEEKVVQKDESAKEEPKVEGQEGVKKDAEEALEKGE